MARTYGDLHLARIVVTEFRIQHPNFWHVEELAGFIEMQSGNFVGALDCFARGRAKNGDPAKLDRHSLDARGLLVKQAFAPAVLLPLSQRWLAERLPIVLSTMEKWQASHPAGDGTK